MKPYLLSSITKEDINIIKTDQDINEAYNLAVKLSNNFTVEDNDSYDLDRLVYDFIEKNKTKTQPKRISFLEYKLQVSKPLIKKLKISETEAIGLTIKYEDILNENYKDRISVTRSVNEILLLEKPKPAPKTKKAKDKKDPSVIIAELLEQLSKENQSVSPEQVEAIVNSVLKTRKICVEDLCEELLKSIKDTKNIKVHIPKLNTKEFKSDTPNFLKIIDDYAYGNNIFLIGGAGTGKTFLAEMLADFLGLETETINCNQFTSPIEINGGQTIEGYQEGKLIKAWSEGKLLILDELPKLDPNTAGILNEALAKTKLDEDHKRAFIVNTRGDKFKKKAGFGVIATGNVYPNTESSSYGANNKQDLSLLDRFAGSVYEIEKNPEFEKKTILPGHLLLWSIADKIRTLIEVNRWEAQVSIRFMETSLIVYLAEMEVIKKEGSIDKERKTYKDVIDSFLWTFSDVQQKEILKEIKYDSIISKFQYRKMDINKNPF